MKNNKKMTLKTKDEKRRLAFEKRNVKKEQNLAHYGAEGGSALVMAKTADFNRRFIAAVLALVFAISCLVIGVNFAGRADDSEATEIVDGYAMHTKADNGLALSKGLKSNRDGTYDIRLEAYSIGTTKTYTEQIPTDYVLIADQSGSMSTNDVPTGYNNGTTKNWKVSDGANAYYYKETDANGVDHYYRVYRKYGDMYEYHAPDTVYTGNCIGNLSWFQREQVQDLGAASEYYYNPALDTSDMKTGVSTDNRMYPVLVSSQGAALSYWIRFRFTDINGTTYALKYPDNPYYKSPTGGLFGPGDWWGPVPYNSKGLLVGANNACKALSGNNNERYTYGEFLGITTGMYVRQVLFSRHNDYSQLAYRDDNGVEHLLIDATYCNSNGTPIGGACGANGVPSQNHTSTTEAYWNGTLYTASGMTTRLNALKAAMNEFINTVADQQNEDGSKPNHRVAIVGFAGEDSNNTELLTGINLDTSASNKTGYRYFRNETTTQRYKEALLDVTDSVQLQKLRNAVQALDSNGGTEGQYGFYMAKNILDQRELTKFTTKGNKVVDRLTIVVYFTDGTPGNYENDNQYAYGNEVIDAAHQIKTDSKIPNAEIYSIGTFGFADSEPLVYEKYTGNNDEYKFDPDYVKTLSGTWNSGYMYRLWLRNTQGYGDVASDTVYDYMRTITTEYKGATQFVDPSWYGTGTKSDNGNYLNMVDRVRGDPDPNGLRRYFLCTDLSALSRVFTTIGSEQSGASTTVDLNDGYLYDELSTFFSRDELAQDDLLVETFKPNYGANDKIQSWTQTDSSGVEARWNDEKTGVTVTGFNYSDHYVSKTAPNPEKVRLTIRGVKTIITGSEFPSNNNNSGIYAKDEPVAVAAFPIPKTSRYKYTLQTTGANTKPDVTVKFKLTNGAELVNGETYGDLYFTGGYATWPDAENGSTIIFEDVPDNYILKAVVENRDTSGAYTYTLTVNGADKEFSAQDDEKPIDVTHRDSIIKVNSVANSRTVTIKEAVDNSAYASESDKFTPTVYLVPTGDVSVLSDTQRYGTWTLVEGTDYYTTDTVRAIQADSDDRIDLTIPAGWKLIVDQGSQNNYNVLEKNYTPENGNATQFSNGEEITINDNTTIVITNTRPSIPVEGINNSFNHNWIIYILVGITAIAVIAGGIYLWKNKDEFVEE